MCDCEQVTAETGTRLCCPAGGDSSDAGMEQEDDESDAEGCRLGATRQAVFISK